MLSNQEVFDTIYDRLKDQPQGQLTRIAKDKEGHFLVGKWVQFDEIQTTNLPPIPSATHVSIEIPNPPPESRVEQWFARIHDAPRTVTGYGTISMDISPSPFTRFESKDAGLILDVVWRPGGEIRRYDFDFIPAQRATGD